MSAASRERVEALVREAGERHGAGDLAAAEARYREALDLAPGHPGIWHNLGVVRAEAGRRGDAVACFDRALAADPGYASAHFNRAGALLALGRPDEARRSCMLAAAAEPGFYEAHRTLGFLWLAAGDRGRALDRFARTLDLRRGDDRTGIAARSLVRATRAKLRHDAEQFRHLASGARPRKPFALHARAFEAAAGTLGPGVVELDGERLEDLSGIYNTPYHLAEAPEIPGGALGGFDAAAATAEYRARGTGAAWFDGLLSAPALRSLRKYLLESTIWYDFEHIDGFVAAYLEDGLACPLVLQIADEVRARFPEILGAHPLSQAWAFKSLEGGRAIGLHADRGAVSLNFWVTPDDANLAPGRGGLVVCTAPPPPDAEIGAESAALAAFAARHADATERVPYRQNRAALFESRLAHGSDAPRFADGYGNRRISVTLVYGIAP